MIPRSSITAWRATATWPDEAQVEQDLVLSRIMVELFQDERIRSSFAMRGGTALHKLLLPAPLRYSEDIDLVQVVAGPIRPFFDVLHERIDPWLGSHAYRHGSHSVRAVYRFQTESLPARTLRVKIEANTREHFAVQGTRPVRHGVDTRWYTGEAEVVTFSQEELLGTKLRALYQRKKGRDLFDLHQAGQLPGVRLKEVVSTFRIYLEREGLEVSMQALASNLSTKLGDGDFRSDVLPLLAAGVEYDADEAASWVERELLGLGPPTS